MYAPATRIDEYIYVSGGLEAPVSNPNDYKLVSSMIRYHIPTHTWSSCPPMLSARFEHCMVRLPEPKSHCLMVIGGVNTTCDIFNTLTNEWCHAPSMATSRRCFVSCVLNDRIYVFGGTRFTSCAYDIKTNEWIDLQAPANKSEDDDDPPNKDDLRVYGVAVVIDDDTILLMGDYHNILNNILHQQIPWKMPDEEPRYSCGGAYDSLTGSLVVVGLSPTILILPCPHIFAINHCI
jgi:hypothetical protein